MKFDGRDLVLGTAGWAARSGSPPWPASREDDLAAAGEFLADLESGRDEPSPGPDVLFASCALLNGEADARRAFALAGELFAFLNRTDVSPFREEVADLQCASAFAGWRAARLLGDAAAASHWMAVLADLADSTAARHFFETLLDGSAGPEGAERLLADPSRTLLLCEWLRRKNDSDPADVRALTQRLHARARELFEGRETNETHYFRGQLAMTAGVACRQLARRAEAHAWFDRAQVDFRLAGLPEADLARVEYQRLGERLEERDLRTIQESLPALERTFRDLGMMEDALKCRFLEGLSLMETDELPKAADLFRDVCADAERLGNEKLLATAHANLAHISGIMGDADQALAAAAEAIPRLRRLKDRVALSKLHWGLAALLRSKGHLAEAVGAYREALAEHAALGMRADVAALHLVVADLLLDLGDSTEALGEISQALPVIAELGMAREKMAALSLLHESARRRDVDRAALREVSLHLRKPEIDER
jgi:tetratricopeptide (TPR) repeat protein